MTNKPTEGTPDMVCPECGRRLVERKGPYGKFLGCSTFPRCRYRRPLHNTATWRYSKRVHKVF